MKYDYVSVNAQLIGFMLEAATGKSIPQYLEEKIWRKTGTEKDATWSVDSERNRTTKAFCCLNATPYDYAHLGRLYLNYGNWNGEQVIPAGWITESLSIKYPSLDSQGYPYAYFWRSLEGGSSFAKGVLGQYLYINYEKDLMILRFGHSTGEVDWVKIFESIKDQL
jgi:CubicO group peptidase (beta-lactamase class C family)